jgi:plastocyanin
MLKRVARFWPVVAVVVLIGTLGSSMPQSVNPSNAFVTVRRVGDTLVFEPDTVKVRQGDFILWRNDFVETLLVELGTAPMRPGRQRIPARGTGRIQVLLDADTTVYKYTAFLTVGNDTIIVVDPYIDVEPRKK